MVDKKVEKKSKVTTNRSTVEAPSATTANTGFWDFFRFGESYTSLILGIVVVIIAAVLLVSFVKNRNLEQLTKPNPEISSITTSREAENAFPREYTVQPGEDLWKIAEKTYHDGYQWVAIAKANNISNPSQINAGQKIQLPKIDTKSAIAMNITSTPSPTKANPTVAPTAKPTLTPTPKLQAKASITPTQAIRMKTNTYANTTKGGVAMNQSKLSAISGNSYTVVRGDNLWNIAERAYGDGFQWKKIANANHLANPRIIHAGNVLTIPR